MVVTTREHWYFLPSALVDQIESATYFYPAVQQGNRRYRARITQRSRHGGSSCRGFALRTAAASQPQREPGACLENTTLLCGK